MVHRPRLLMTDSGAYTVWRRGRRVDVDPYIEWCREWRAQGHSFAHVNLDVIPEDLADVDRAVEAGRHNAGLMRDAGLPTIEVYHHGEDLRVLDELLERRESGLPLGVSGRQSAGVREQQAFFDMVWAHVTARHGREVPPFHALGVSSRDLIFRYPWWSVDSSAWCIPSRWGKAQNPRSGEWARLSETTSLPRDNALALTDEHLRTWAKWQGDLSRLWERRGVTWLP